MLNPGTSPISLRHGPLLSVHTLSPLLHRLPGSLASEAGPVSTRPGLTQAAFPAARHHAAGPRLGPDRLPSCPARSARAAVPAGARRGEVVGEHSRLSRGPLGVTFRESEYPAHLPLPSPLMLASMCRMRSLHPTFLPSGPQLFQHLVLCLISVLSPRITMGDGNMHLHYSVSVVSGHEAPKEGTGLVGLAPGT